MTEAVPGGSVRFQEELDRSFGELEGVDKMIEKCKRSKRIIEGIVPVSVGGVFCKGIESERLAKIAQGM